jgi:hypothetical protein
MELKDIVAISGKRGLHKVIGRSKNGIIVETIGSGLRFSTGYQDKVSVLADISMYTLDGDLRLSDVFLKLKAANNVPDAKADIKVVRNFLIDTIQLDSERVYDSDIKKLITWYNLLKDVLNFDALAESASKVETISENVESVSEQKEETIIEEKLKQGRKKKDTNAK